MTDDDLTQRLHRLESIVGQSRIPPSGQAGAGVEEVHLHEVRTQRMRLLTDELGARVTDSVDALDGVELRLLLDDLLASVGHLREIARIARRRCDAAAGVIKETRHFTRDEATRLLRQAKSGPAGSATS